MFYNPDKLSHRIGEVIGTIILALLALWFMVSCMQVANQNVAPWNLIELLF